MKKAIIHILFCLAALPVWAQPADKIDISGVSVEADGPNVRVSFTARVGRKASAGSQTVVYAPVITDGEYKVSLPAIVVQNRRARKSWERREWAADVKAAYENGIYTRNRETIYYNQSVPFQEWMRRARIDIERVAAGCCESQTDILAMANPMLPTPPPPAPVEQKEIPLAEFLTNAFSFVMPATEYKPNLPVRFYDEDREKSLTVYFRLDRYNIDEAYMDNYQTLRNLISAIELIRESDEADVERVVIAGFASPEGPALHNERLAYDRAVSLRDYIARKTGMPESRIDLFNGGADWSGLRLMVANDGGVPGRREVLDIIDYVPIWDHKAQRGRQTVLRNLRGGESYRYIARNIFPKLRNGAFIRVFFNENKKK